MSMTVVRRTDWLPVRSKRLAGATPAAALAIPLPNAAADGGPVGRIAPDIDHAEYPQVRVAPLYFLSVLPALAGSTGWESGIREEEALAGGGVYTACSPLGARTQVNRTEHLTTCVLTWTGRGESRKVEANEPLYGVARSRSQPEDLENKPPQGSA